jgi:predicted TPR repeat methyltransferase
MKRKKKKAKPRAVAALIQDALERHKAGELAEAEALYEQILAQQPDHADALNLLGMIVLERGDPRAAARLMARAVAASPTTAQYHLNLGTALVAAGIDELGVEAFEHAARLGNLVARYNLGLQHLRHDRRDRAIEELRVLLELDPEHALAKYLLTGLTDGRVDALGAGHVVALFDAYATSFEEHLVRGLGYQVPRALAEAVASAAGTPERAWTVLDLGCGTGLCGDAFRGVARRLVGTDLSAKMIEVATARGVYDELYTEDLVATLARETASVDLIVAADVFIYVGALEAAFAASAAALRDGGLFAFSTEPHDGEGFHFQTTSRYAHSETYVRELGRRSGLAIVQAAETTLRMHDGKPILGRLYLLRKGEAASHPPG